MSSSSSNASQEAAPPLVVGHEGRDAADRLCRRYPELADDPDFIILADGYRRLPELATGHTPVAAETLPGAITYVQRDAALSSHYVRSFAPADLPLCPSALLTPHSRALLPLCPADPLIPVRRPCMPHAPRLSFPSAGVCAGRRPVRGNNTAGAVRGRQPRIPCSGAQRGCKRQPCLGAFSPRR